MRSDAALATMIGSGARSTELGAGPGASGSGLAIQASAATAPTDSARPIARALMHGAHVAGPAAHCTKRAVFGRASAGSGLVDPAVGRVRIPVDVGIEQ